MLLAIASKSYEGQPSRQGSRAHRRSAQGALGCCSFCKAPLLVDRPAVDRSKDRRGTGAHLGRCDGRVHHLPKGDNEDALNEAAPASARIGRRACLLSAVLGQAARASAKAFRGIVSSRRLYYFNDDATSSRQGLQGCLQSRCH
jgi:hypothetical protein